MVNLELRISPRIFEKIRKGPYDILRGLGETDSWKKPETKSRDTVPLTFSLLRECKLCRYLKEKEGTVLYLLRTGKQALSFNFWEQESRNCTYLLSVSRHCPYLFSASRHCPYLLSTIGTVPTSSVQVGTVPSSWVQEGTVPSFWGQVGTLPNSWEQVSTLPSYLLRASRHCPHLLSASRHCPYLLRASRHRALPLECK